MSRYCIGGVDIFVGVSWMDWIIVSCVVVSILIVAGVGADTGGRVGTVDVVVGGGQDWVGLVCVALVVGCGLEVGVEDCGLWSGDWGKEDWVGLGCSVLGGLWKKAVRFEVVVQAVDSSLVGGVLIVGGRLWSWDTDLVEVCGRQSAVANMV